MVTSPATPHCGVCRQAPARTGVLCEDCSEELWTTAQITPQQIEHQGTGPTKAALIDVFGRPYRLDPETTIGRSSDHARFAIREPSVSREHARISCAAGESEPGQTIWTLHDLASANGTYVNDVQTQAATLRHRDRVKFGDVALFFVDDALQLPPPPPEAITATTVRLNDSRPSSTKMLDPVPSDLPLRTFRFQEPTGGGGGIIEIGTKRVQLSVPQFELMRSLVDRMLAEAGQPKDERGFVRASELLARLSLDARDPNENNIRQLVRRLRLVLIKAGIGDLIESRYRSGYRLRVTPHTK